MQTFLQYSSLSYLLKRVSGVYECERANLVIFMSLLILINIKNYIYFQVCLFRMKAKIKNIKNV